MMLMLGAMGPGRTSRAAVAIAAISAVVLLLHAGSCRAHAAGLGSETASQPTSDTVFMTTEDGEAIVLEDAWGGRKQTGLFLKMEGVTISTNASFASPGDVVAVMLKMQKGLLIEAFHSCSCELVDPNHFSTLDIQPLSSLALEIQVHGQVQQIKYLDATVDNEAIVQGTLYFYIPMDVHVETTLRFNFKENDPNQEPFAVIGDIHVRGKAPTKSQHQEYMPVPHSKTLDPQNNVDVDYNCTRNFRASLTKQMKERGQMSAQMRSEMIRAIHICGLIVIDGLLDTTFVEELKESILSYVCMYGRATNTTLATTGACRSRESSLTPVPIMSVNAEGRFEFVTPFEEPFSNPKAWANSIILSILNSVLSPKFVIESIGGFNAIPNATDQKWHIDNEYALFNNQPNIPPYCMTLAIPLVDCNSTSGCTEFVFRSHRCKQTDENGDRKHVDAVDLPCQTMLENVWPAMPSGSAMLYDQRVMHRGRANIGKIDRPMLHTSYCHGIPTHVTASNFAFVYHNLHQVVILQIGTVIAGIHEAAPFMIKIFAKFLTYLRRSNTLFSLVIFPGPHPSFSCFFTNIDAGCSLLCECRASDWRKSYGSNRG